MSSTNGNFLYVGSWDLRKKSSGNGFGICRYDPKTGGLDKLGVLPLDVAVGGAHVHGKVLYCTDEATTLPGYSSGGGGQVYAFAIDGETGDLTEINHSPSYGSLPSHVAIDASGKYLVVVHHTDKLAVTKIVRDAKGKFQIVPEHDDATTVLFRLGEDGAIGEPLDMLWHNGVGGPHGGKARAQLHTVGASPIGNLFVTTNMTTDEILFFRINHATEKLELCTEAGFKTIPGGAPRLSVFHPTRPYLFINYGDKALVGAFRYDEAGKVEDICTVSALPDGVEDHPEMKQTDIAIHPSGKYLYSLVRGINSVSVFGVDDATGRIERIQTALIEGESLRGSAVSPDGRFFYIAALGSSEVLVWAIGEDGRLSATGRKIDHPNPGVVTFG